MVFENLSLWNKWYVSKWCLSNSGVKITSFITGNPQSKSGEISIDYLWDVYDEYKTVLQHTIVSNSLAYVCDDFRFSTTFRLRVGVPVIKLVILAPEFLSTHKRNCNKMLFSQEVRLSAASVGKHKYTYPICLTSLQEYIS